MSSSLESRLDATEQRLNEGDQSFESLRAEVGEIREHVAVMRQDMATVKEIVVAWNNVKGFVTTIQVLAKIGTVCVRVAAFLGLVYMAGKLGEWKVAGWLFGK